MANLTLTRLLSRLIGAVVTIVLHEWVKAVISNALSDPLPKRDGRLSLNPLKHIEPVGFFAMAIIGFGWGKPVETASIYYKDRKKGPIVTYTIPSIVNLLFGILLIPLMKLSNNADIYAVLETVVLLNLRHAFFNIIPVYPMDGAKVLNAFLSPNRVIALANKQSTMQLGLIVDNVTDLVDIDEDKITSPPQVGDNYAHVFVKEIGILDEGVTLVIDPERLVNINELDFLEEDEDDSL